MVIKFTQSEIEEMQGNPYVLRALAEIHEIRDTMGSATGADCSVNRDRKAELLAEADRIILEWEA